MQIEGLSALVKLEELTIRHNQILRQVLLRPYVCFCLPTMQVCWAFWLHKCAVCMLCVHVCQFCPIVYAWTAHIFVKLKMLLSTLVSLCGRGLQSCAGATGTIGT